MALKRPARTSEILRGLGPETVPEQYEAGTWRGTPNVLSLF